MQLFTIGYEGLNPEQFFFILQAHEIDCIVDVRQMPLSRKRGFSKKALAEAAAFRGLDYVHAVELGCPRSIRDQYQANGDWQNYTEQFTRYIHTQDESIADLISLAREKRCCLLCFEANAFYCHRSLVARRVRDESQELVEIEHLTAESVGRCLAQV